MKNLDELQKGENVRYIYRRWITVNGKRVYPKKAKAFRIPVRD